MYKISFVCCLLGLLFTFSRCASSRQNRWLADHRQNLQRLADSKLPAEQKLDGLVQDYVLFMQEDLKFVDPLKGIKYVQKYHDQNEKAMDKILNEAGAWQGNLSNLDRIALGLRVVQKPYLKEVIDLAPKFKRKYKQYAFAVKLVSKITGGLTRFAGKELGL